jgi:PAS domain S-box-containing protein
MSFNAFTIIYFLTALLALVVALVCWNVKTGRWLALCMVATAEWAFADGLECAVSGMAAKETLHSLAYVGAEILPVCYFLFAMQYNRLDRWITRRNVVLLLAIPAIGSAMLLMPAGRRLFWDGVFLDPLTNRLIEHDHGPLWLPYIMGYPYLLVAAATALIAWAIVRFPPPYKPLTIVILLTSLVPWLVSLIYLSGLIVCPGWDPSPEVVAFAGLILAWNLSSTPYGDLLPVARDRLVEWMNAGVLVLDDEERVMDINPSAKKLLDLSAKEVIGRPLHRVMTAPPEMTQPQGPDSPAHWEIATNHGLVRHLELVVSELRDRRGHLSGRLIIIRDVTDRKLAELERERLLIELQQALAEVKTLSGLLPICSSCKKVRDDTGYWTQIEQYIQTRSDAVFTHGLCPDCLGRFEAEIKQASASLPPSRRPVKDD